MGMELFGLKGNGPNDFLAKIAKRIEHRVK